MTLTTQFKLMLTGVKTRNFLSHNKFLSLFPLSMQIKNIAIFISSFQGEKMKLNNIFENNLNVFSFIVRVCWKEINNINETYC